MAKSPARCSSWRNPSPIGKDELAGPAPTQNNDTNTPSPAVSHAPTFAPSSTLLLVLTPTINSMDRYSKADLQRIFRTVLEARPPALALAS